MDPNHSFHFSSNFTDHLNNQEEVKTVNHLPNVPTSIQITPFEIPQYSNVGEKSDDVNEVQNTNDRTVKRSKWSPPEDIVLINGWLNISKDPIVGNNQKAAAFWKRTASYYSLSLIVSTLPKREASHCKKRWQKLNDSVCKFVGCYDHNLCERTSGQSKDDALQVAYQFYYNDYKSNFALEHAWRELQHDQKWCSSYIPKISKDCGSSKRTKLNEGGTYSSSSNPKSPINLNGEEKTMARPLGVKSSKRKAKNVATKTTFEEREHLWSQKEKDTAERNKLSRMEVLTRLLSKQTNFPKENKL